VRAPAAPITPRTIDECVTEIVNVLGTDLKAEAQAYIGAAPKLKTVGPAVGNKRANAKLAEDLLNWIARGEKLFGRLKGGDLLLFFSPPGPVRTPEDLELATRRAEDWRDVWLNALRSRCKWTIAGGIGEHGHVDHMQRAAAIAAAELCSQAGKPLAWSSAESPYRRVASLIFEGMTGRADADLERACEFAAHRKDRRKLTKKSHFTP
jgi:hypothetical protein